MKVELVLRCGGVEIVRKTAIDLPVPGNWHESVARQPGFTEVLRGIINHSDTEDRRFLDVQAGAYFAGMMSALVGALYGTKVEKE